MHSGQWWRAAFSVLALVSSVVALSLVFSADFGQQPRPAPLPPAPALIKPTTIAVVSDNFWLTYLPAGLERTGGGVIAQEEGVDGGWARFGTGEHTVEAQVEHGTVAAEWETYRKRADLERARETTVRGKPAVVGAHPEGGKMIVWLERVGTGAWIRVSESLAKELLAIAASVKAPVGD
ncbi:hypothetical protein [Nonomuraea endophytica]|uniref:DUF4245 domain-containing protein n=1 Tax=Nonomuraea endophytica TaxID=714136 RepID=A0A7W7ZXM0_9ACTN|nr:hypothetical protein [Nonomuraea endophytica]MBB5075155.1 hypothetical protein [Nonomuraea endophytica]